MASNEDTEFWDKTPEHLGTTRREVLTAVIEQVRKMRSWVHKNLNGASPFILGLYRPNKVPSGKE
ncbi:hypothetical protein IMZ48_36690 [Candidatus Bathyarchaeota archaeon]|nr:hypothetical protein [Candidatus Bathyarchaeota archaeon]